MHQLGPRALHLSTCDAERKRIQDLSRYYCTLDQPSSPPDDAKRRQDFRSTDNSSQNEQLESARLSSDITLTALAQLGVHRFGCNRSFVSLIDGDNQHLIAEATASVSLRNKDKHLPNDGIYLGVRTLDLVWGVCPHAIRLFTGQDLSYAVDTQNVTASPSRYIIRDFTKEDLFKDRPYVREWPFFRFYAEVPLYSASGFVLGSFCVVDDKPRAVFNDAEVETLQEIADAIAKHLENVRIVHCHRRSDKLVKGLTSFVKDCADFDPRQLASDHRLETTALETHSELSQSHHQGNAISPFPASSRGMTGEPYPVFSPGPASRYTDPSSLNSGVSDRPASPSEERLETLIQTQLSRKTKVTAMNDSQESVGESMSLADQNCAIFSRASILLRDSMDLDGVVFLDAACSNPSVQHCQDQAGGELLPKSAAPKCPMSPCPSPLDFSQSDVQTSESLCYTLSAAFKVTSSDSTSINPPKFGEELLALLISRYPQGQIFTLDASTDDDANASFKNSDSPITGDVTGSQKISQQIMQLLPGAQSVLFSPLWDYNKSRWLAVTLVWTRDSHRALGTEELQYFKVFGDSIVSEVSRLHWMATEQSKFNFISSISHELRSPLHGILASAELLHGTDLQPAQEEIVRMIETSGLTLLDTTDHLLEFCKINSLVRAKSRGETSPPFASSLVSDFDLGVLVEEVANILYTGQNAPTTPVLGGVNSSLLSNDTDTAMMSDNSPTSLVVRIVQSQPWQIRSLPGAWRRIVMNLLGNAIKWTKSGLIEISLSRASHDSVPDGFLAHLTVMDTGSGISADFLKHKLFTPFSQEDALTEGVGLGLSIVRQLVSSLEGHVNVRSELGIGTQVDVFIPVQHLEISGSDRRITGSVALSLAADLSIPPLHACLVAFNSYPDLKEAPTGMLTVDAKRKLSIQSTLADIFMSRFGWSVSMAESLEKGRGDIAVVEEATLNAANRDSTVVTNEFKYYLVLGGKSSSESISPNIIRVPQPFGPQKIQAAVQKILELREKLAEPHSETADLSSGLRQRPTSIYESSPPPVDATTPTTSVSNEKIATIPPPIISDQNSTKPRYPHVLIVDDNDINLKIMATFLHKMNCTYDTASNGLIALEKYKSSPRQYNFVLMDISMPIMDGLVSTGKIREFERDHNLAPACIMAVTGVASQHMQVQALRAGIDEYLIKPLSLKGLRKLMNLA